MKLFESRGLEFEPGSKWAYSNYGLVLLGGVIEKVPGMSYYDFLSENIFEKGGMHSTGSLPEAAPAGAGYGFGAWRGCARHERRTAGLSEDGDRVVVLANLDPPAATRVADIFDEKMPLD